MNPISNRLKLQKCLLEENHNDSLKIQLHIYLNGIMYLTELTVHYILPLNNRFIGQFSSCYPAMHKLWVHMSLCGFTTYHGAQMVFDGEK